MDVGEEIGIKKDRRLFHMTMCVNGLFFDMKFFKLADGGRFLKPSADGKYIGDNRISGARGCSHLDGTK